MTFESNEKLPKNPIIPHVNWERVRRSWTLVSYVMKTHVE